MFLAVKIYMNFCIDQYDYFRYQYFDLQIALIALENSATHIWTHDRNFVGVPGLKIHDPI